MTATFRVYRDEYKTNGDTTSTEIARYTSRERAEAVAGMLTVLAAYEVMRYNVKDIKYTVELFQEV